ncbi:TRAP transporter small permease [Coralloluteibacterium stylophorae]|uniref:TRAP transporter small permease protein n=1 Tax=Coralloluteibacterium stylophorae TaxID=1776034 RepID=A0A8J7VSN3_9GAMM|nr:TRAP transporter small permease [Coralloluteibacterium stylophorae]MBS7458169.1 TRAP transporter small permease [Coralloluteibacterium stylophorae]
MTGGLHRALARLAQAATAVAGIGLVGMALVQAWQVFARYVLNDSPGWTEPVTLLLMSTTMMFGAAVCVRANSHFGFFLLVQLAPPPLARALRALASVVVIAIGAALAAWGLQLLLADWDAPMAGAPLPQGLMFLPICIGGALVALFGLERLVQPVPPAYETEAE